MPNKLVKKRGPNKKAGFRQELRITPIVEEAFKLLRDRYELRNNSEALNKIAQIFMEYLNLN